MNEKSTAERVAHAIGNGLAVIFVIFAAFISAIFSMAKKS